MLILACNGTILFFNSFDEFWRSSIFLWFLEPAYCEPAGSLWIMGELAVGGSVAVAVGVSDR